MRLAQFLGKCPSLIQYGPGAMTRGCVTYLADPRRGAHVEGDEAVRVDEGEGEGLVVGDHADGDQGEANAGQQEEIVVLVRKKAAPDHGNILPQADFLTMRLHILIRLIIERG